MDSTLLRINASTRPARGRARGAVGDGTGAPVVPWPCSTLSLKRTMASNSDCTSWFWNSFDLSCIFLPGVAEKCHLDEHGGHVRANQDAERRLLDRASVHRHVLRHFLLRRSRRTPLTRSGASPAPSPRGSRRSRASRRRARAASAPRPPLGGIDDAIGAEMVDLRADDVLAQRRVDVQAEKEVGLVVVGQRRALVERARGCRPRA